MAHIAAQILIHCTEKIILAQYQKHQKLKEQQKKHYNQFALELKQKSTAGMVMKQSKHFHKWHQRKIIVSKTMIGTFEVHGDTKKCTDWTRLFTIDHCQQAGQLIVDGHIIYLFTYHGEDKHMKMTTFKFGCKTKQLRDKWVQFIKGKTHIK